MRDVGSWYVSYCLCYTTAMTDTLLSRAIRMLAGGEARAVPRRRDREILSRHRRELLARLRNEDACADSLEGLSAEFLVWFTRTVRLDGLMNAWVGIDRLPDWRMGLLTFRAITILFDDPAKVFRMRPAETEGYFASGRYLRDLRCDLFLDFDRLTDDPPWRRWNRFSGRSLSGCPMGYIDIVRGSMNAKPLSMPAIRPPCTRSAIQKIRSGISQYFPTPASRQYRCRRRPLIPTQRMAFSVSDQTGPSPRIAPARNPHRGMLAAFTPTHRRR